MRAAAANTHATMKVQLIISDHCHSCTRAIRLWEGLCQEMGLDFQCLDTAHSEGRRLADRHRLKTFPALLIDDQVKLVGLPSTQTARQLITTCLDGTQP